MIYRSRRPVAAEGSVCVLLLVSLAVIIGLLALNLDGGRMMDERRKVQNTADAAALAAARDLYDNDATNHGLDPDGSAADAARAFVTANGYSSSGGTSACDINIPPLTGAFQGQATYVEVTVRSTLKSSFAAFFTRNELVVERRAAARGLQRKVGILALSPTGTGLSFHTKDTMKVTDAGVYINSSDSQALDLSRGTLQASPVNVVGGTSGSIDLVQGTVRTGVKAATDPLAALPEPDPTAYPIRTYSAGDTTLQPGIYRGGFTLSNAMTVTLQPGIYIIDGGGIQLSGQINLVGNQVMIFNTSLTQPAGGISISGNGSLTLTPPTSGAYTGINLFQARAVDKQLDITGNGTLQMTGTVYAPSADVRITGNGASDVIGGSYIARSFDIGGTGSFEVKHARDRPRLPDVHLVE